MNKAVIQIDRQIISQCSNPKPGMCAKSPFEVVFSYCAFTKGSSIQRLMLNFRIKH